MYGNIICTCRGYCRHTHRHRDVLQSYIDSVHKTTIEYVYNICINGSKETCENNKTQTSEAQERKKIIDIQKRSQRSFCYALLSFLLIICLQYALDVALRHAFSAFGVTMKSAWLIPGIHNARARNCERNVTLKRGVDAGTCDGHLIWRRDAKRVDWIW